MRAIIPVAGVGTRLRPHTYSTPKVLLNVAGKPIIAHIMDKLIEEGIDEATVVVGHLGEMIEKYLHAQYERVKLDFITQHERLGLAHSIHVARETFDDEPILIILGDTIFDVDLAPVLSGETSSLGVKHVKYPRRFGVAVKDGDTITRLVEKPDTSVSNLALVGLYYIRNTRLLKEAIQDLIDRDIKTRGEYQLTDALQLMIERGEAFTTFDVEGWYDCGKPETVLSTNRILLEKAGDTLELPGVVIIPPVYVDPSARIENAVIGPYVTVAAGAVVENSVIRDSIVAENASVHASLLDSSLIGNNASVSGRFSRLNAGDSTEIHIFS